MGELLAVSVDGAFHVPCYDHNGNVVRYVSETGTASAQYVYDPYGNVVESSGPLADTFAFGSSTKWRDRETGLVAYQRRFYSPGLGRWLSRDPIEERGGENLYAFGRTSTPPFPPTQSHARRQRERADAGHRWKRLGNRFSFWTTAEVNRPEITMTIKALHPE